MTDAVARQQIQRWTTQLVAPEYVGAHVSSPTSHTTGPDPRPGLPRRDRAVRLLRHRVGPDRGVRGRPRPAGGVGAALPAVPAVAALRPRGPARVAGPDGAAARRGRRRPVGGAGRARPARRARAQPRGLGARARARPGGVVRRALGGSGRPPGGEHVVAAAAASARPRGRRSPAARWRTRGLWIPRRRPETVTLVHLVRV